MTAPDLSWLAIYLNLIPVDPPGDAISALLDEDPPRLLGDAGWQLVARPRRKAITEWQGLEPVRLRCSIVFDGFDRGIHVERECEQLRRWMRVPASSLNEPTILRVEGAAVPAPARGLRWVIESIEPGAEIRARPGSGQAGMRVRAHQVVTLLEHVTPDVLAPQAAQPSPAEQAAETAPEATAGRTVEVHSGDTLYEIAQRELGNGNRWQEIADLNGIRDPRRLAVGQVLRLP